MKTSNQSNAILILKCVALFALAWSFLTSFMGDSVTTIYQVRDLNRALGLCNGEYILHGPEMSFGGFLPGPFYYWLIAPFVCAGGWSAVWYLFAGLTSLAAALIWLGFKSLYGERIALFSFFTFLGSEHVLQNLLRNWNPALLNVFSPVITLGLLYAFISNSKKRSLALYASLFLTGLTLQVHMSSFFLFVAFLLLQVFPKTPWQKFSRIEVVVGLVLFALPSLPYLISGELAKSTAPNPSLLVAFDFNIIEILNFFKNLWLFQIKFFPTFIVFVPAILIFLLFRNSKIELHKSHFIKGSALIMLASAPLLLSSHFVENFFSPRYSLVFEVAYLFFATSLLAQLWHNVEEKKKDLMLDAVVASLLAMATYEFASSGSSGLSAFMSIAALIFVILVFVSSGLKRGVKTNLLFVSFLVLFASKPFPITHAYPLYEFFPENSVLQRAAEKVCQQTGWGYQSFRQRAFMVNINYEADFEFVYNEVCSDKEKKSQTPSGYFFANLSEHDERVSLWWKSSSLPKLIVEGIESGDMSLLEKIDVTQGYYLIPYEVKNAQKLPEHFHNLGQQYVLPEESKEFRDLKLQKGVDALKVSDQKVLFYEICEENELDCLSGVTVEIDTSSEQLVAEVLVFGAPLSQRLFHTKYEALAQWTQPKLVFFCGEKSEEHVLADVIGLPTEYPSLPYFKGEAPILAPLKRKLALNCKEAPNRIELHIPKRFTQKNFARQEHELLKLEIDFPAAP